MIICKAAVTIPSSVEKVFEYVTAPDNFPHWQKDVWATKRAIGKMGIGCRIVQTIRLINSRMFTMHVTGFEQNSYFKIEALKGFFILPCYTFYFKRCNEQETDINVSVELKGKAGDDARVIRQFYPLGVDQHWKVYLELLALQIKKKEKEERIIYGRRTQQVKMIDVEMVS